jgi:hypothetical protein
VPVHVVEQLASEPDFTDAAIRAEEVTTSVDDELVSGNGHSDNADEVTIPHEAPSITPEQSATSYSNGEGIADAVRCDDCQAVVPANIIAYCQSAKGRQAFGGANYCFVCQKKHRPAGKAAA